MKLKYVACALLLGVLYAFVMPYHLDAQAYVKYADQCDLKSRTIYSDSVLTFVPMPKGVVRLDSYPKINAAALELSHVRQQGGELLGVWVCGSSSPEGNLKENAQLAQERADAAAAYISDIADVPEHMILKENYNEDWYALYRLVQEKDVPCKYDVLFIIRTMQGEERKDALKDLDGGRVWDYMCRELFPQIRGVRFAFFCRKGYDLEKEYVVDTVYVRDTVVIVKEIFYMDQQPAAAAPSETPIVSEAPKPSKNPRQFQTPALSKTPKSPKVSKGSVSKTLLAAVKTDIVTDALALPQIGVEVGVSDRMSVELMGWYSEWPYINPCKEHKVYGFRPEIRYWVNGAMSNGLFFGVHANIAWYAMMVNDTDFYQNASLCKDAECTKTHFYRYMYQNQDGVNVTNLYHDTPAWSAGITAGYALQLDKAGRWGAEFVGGIGYGHYEQNLYKKSDPWSLVTVESPQVKDYFGLTRASVNLVYRFSIRKKNNPNVE